MWGVVFILVLTWNTWDNKIPHQEKNTQNENKSKKISIWLACVYSNAKVSSNHQLSLSHKYFILYKFFYFHFLISPYVFFISFSFLFFWTEHCTFLCFASFHPLFKMHLFVIWLPCGKMQSFIRKQFNVTMQCSISLCKWAKFIILWCLCFLLSKYWTLYRAWF